MKKFTIYNVYLDSGYDDDDVYKIVVPAESKEEAAKYCEGNGEIIAVKENTNVQDIDISALADCLRSNKWNKTEIDVIVRALAMCGLARN
mgnify:CR=1 FL=1